MIIYKIRTMQIIQRSFFYLFCFCLMACSYIPNELKVAEQQMETAPDSSLKILKKLQPRNINGAYNNALYALLMSQALDKNENKVESDSLISIATDYFDASDPVHAGYAWFYHSRTANNRDSVSEQANNLLKAQEYAEQTNDNKLKGLVYSEKAFMYKNQQQYDSSICYYKYACKSFYKIPDKRNIILCLFKIGDNFLFLSKCDSALYYTKKAEKLVSKNEDILILSSLYKSIGTIYYQLNDYKQALHYYMLVPDTKINIYDSNKCYLIAKTYIKINEIDSARKYLEKVTELQNMAPDYYRLWQAIYKKQGNTQKYIFYANKVNFAIDSLYTSKLAESFAGLEKKYKFQRLKIENQSLIINNKQKEIIIFFALFVLIIFVVIVLFWRLRVKKNQLLVQKQLLINETALVLVEKEKLEKEKENNALLEKQLKLQNILLSNIEMHQTNILKRPLFWREGSKETIEKQYNAFYNELKTYVDMEFNNFTIRLKEKYPLLTENDILISCLLIAQFETGMIATILNVQTDTLNKYRYRLRTKLKLTNSDNLHDFLLHF